MRYRAVLPTRNSNVSNKSPLKEFLALLAGLILVILLIYSILGLIIDHVVSSISDETELAIFQLIKSDQASELFSKFDNESKSKSNQALLDELLSCTDIPYPVELKVTNSDTINAFAFPSGQIILQSGLLDAIKSENGLAFVLAHELSHFKNRDHLRAMGRGVVLLSFSVLLTGTDSNISQIISPVINLEFAQHSQSRETLADASALDILNCHYGHIGGATELFEVMAKPEGFDFALTHYFASHPQAIDRINAINTLGESLGYQVKPVEKLQPNPLK